MERPAFNVSKNSLGSLRIVICEALISKRGDNLSNSFVNPPSAATGDEASDIVDVGLAFEYLRRGIFCDRPLVCTPRRATRLQPTLRLRTNMFYYDYTLLYLNIKNIDIGLSL